MRAFEGTVRKGTKEMDRDVIIHIRGLQSANESGEAEPIEIVVPGQYYLKNGIHYFRYEEHLDESMQPTANYIKVLADGTMEVRKSGQVNTTMLFEKGKQNLTSYVTPFGTIQMSIMTTGIEMDIQEHRVELKAEYELDINEEHVADCFIQILAESLNSPDLVL